MPDPPISRVRLLDFRLPVGICLLLASLVATSARGDSATSSSASRPAPPPQKGIVLGLFHEVDTIGYAKDLDEIVDLGCNSVSLAVVLFQDDFDSTSIYARAGKTAPDARIRETITLAKARGLRVMLFPYVVLAHPSEGKWRGALAPKDIEAWWRSYDEHILRLAGIAQEAGADALSVGSELASMEKHVDQWQGLIHEARQAFKGQLTYTANWDHRDLAFWDDVDFLSMSSYFEIGRTKEEQAQSRDSLHGWNGTLQQLIDGWRPFHDDIVAWYDRVGKGRPLVLAEVGYPSMDGGARFPWDYTKDSPADPEEQKLCYEAFRQVWEGSPIVSGVYFYAWFGDGGPKDAGYTPRGKPAVQVVRSWFRGTPPDSPATETGS